MSSTKEYLNFILEQIDLGEELSVRPMMGEYLLYFKGKLVGGIYDDRLLLKPVKVVADILPNVELVSPYEGAKPMYFIEEEDGELLRALIEAVANELPEPKPKRKK